MRNNQSSVESLFEKLWDTPKDKFTWYAILEEHKAMHKEEHAETFSQGMQWIQYQRDLVNGGSEYWDKEPKHFEEYYNETFKK